MPSYRFRRYVVEDRWTAIRWAIGTAQKKDIVVVAGKGAEDYQEYVFDGQIVRVGPLPLLSSMAFPSALSCFV